MLIPEPIFKYDSSDISIEFRKDIYNEKHLKTLNLSDRQVKAILFVKDKGKITNSDYQTLNDVSKATATRDLTELTETHKILKRPGDIGVGTNYILIGSIIWFYLINRQVNRIKSLCFLFVILFKWLADILKWQKSPKEKAQPLGFFRYTL
jgi:hypothetical protein